MVLEELNATIVKALVKKYATIAMESEKKNVRGVGGKAVKSVHIATEKAE